MKYVDEYRDVTLINPLIERLKNFHRRSYAFMEVCGGHTMAIHRFGLPSLLPDNIRLLSGPGCPVCVTGKSVIDKAIAYARMNDFIITTYGDLIRVPGSESSLEKEKSKGRDIRIVFSPIDAMDIAVQEPRRKVIFIGIGFETTAPGSAVAIREAARRGLSNFFLLSAHKVMPPAMEAIITGGVALDGFICPGHVSAVTGSSIYDFIAHKYGLPCVVTGFEPADMIQAIYMLVLQVEKAAPTVEIQYRRAVTREGNILAQKQMSEVFYLADDWWRGLGVIPRSGLKLREKYADFDAGKVFPVEGQEPEEDQGCACGDVLRGVLSPVDCKLFAKSCNPSHPVGACMVSSEGACQAYFKYHRND